MNSQSIDELKRHYAGKCVQVDSTRPELARWAGVLGRIKTINQNGQALVQFDGADQGWHDFDLDVLRITELSAKPLRSGEITCQKAKAAGGK